jgi:ADP-heptose:LPS heptosyltransferase
MLSVAQVDKIIYGLSVLQSRWINSKKDPAAMDFRRILIIRMDEIGDLCYSGPVFTALCERYPQAELTLWCKPFARSLMEDHPALNHIVTDEKSLSGHYDLMVDLRGKWEGLRYAWSHPPLYRLERGKVRLMHRKAGGHPHALDTNFEIIRPLLAANTPIPTPALYPGIKAREEAKVFIEQHQLKRFAVIHAGARRELRRWPAERFVAISDMLHREYGMQIIFVGDPSETDLIQSIQSQLSFTTFSTVGKLSLAGFAALMNDAALFIGNESGPLHIASLSGTPSLGLYGPGEPKVFYPLAKKSAVIHYILECNPCDQVHCKHPNNPCIQRISMEEVTSKIEQLLAIG